MFTAWLVSHSERDEKKEKKEKWCMHRSCLIGKNIILTIQRHDTDINRKTNADSLKQTRVVPIQE